MIKVNQEESTTHNPQPTTTNIPAKGALFILVVILILGFCLRAIWIPYSLPFPGYFSSDEIDVVGRTLKLTTLDFAPSHFDKPTFYTLVILPFYGLAFGFMRITGAIFTREDFVRIFIQRPTLFYMIPRMISVVSGSLTLLLCYLIGKRVKNKQTGVLAALILSCCYTSVQLSHTGKEDALLCLLIIFSLYLSIIHYEKDSVFSLFFSAFFCGLATATKYTGALCVVFPVFFALLKISRKSLVSGLSYVFLLIPIGVLLGFSLGMPYFVLHPVKCMEGVFSSTVFEQIKGDTVWLGGIRHYGIWFIMRMFYMEFGLLLSIGGAVIFVTLVVSLFKESEARFLFGMNTRIFAPLIIYFGIFFLILAISGHLDYQYIMPLSPLWAIFVALFLSSLMKKKKNFYVYLILFVMLIQPLYRSIRFDKETLGTDTRIEAAKWIEKNIPQTNKIAFDTKYYYQYHPPVRLSVKTIRSLEKEALETGGSGRYFSLLAKHQKTEAPLYEARFLPMPTWLHRMTHEETDPYSVTRLHEDGYDWVIISGYYFQRLIRDENPGWQKLRDFYLELKTRGKEVVNFKPGLWKNMGPEIIIYYIGE